MPGFDFEGETYRDDRLFVLYVASCTVAARGDEWLETTIYHEQAPADHLWCVVRYRNTATYPAEGVDHFRSFEAAQAFVQHVEPHVPLVSLGGRSPAHPLSYDLFVRWKAHNRMADYDYTSLYSPNGHNRRELVLTRRP